MLSRALSLAAVMLSILVAASETWAQNLDAGKSASQIFSSTCSVCHRSPRGLLKTVQPGSLPGFLREHYTTGRDMAGQLSAYLLSSGATDPRGAGGLTKQGQNAKTGGQGEPRPADQQQQGRRQRPGQLQDAAKPDADGLSPDPRAGRTRRNRAEQQQAAPGPDGQPAAVDENAVTKRQKQKMGKKKGREEAPKGSPKEGVKDAPVPVEADRPDAAPAEMPPPPEPAPVVIDPKIDAPKSQPAPPAEPARPNDSASGTPSLRPDPVPPVTPAPKSNEIESRPVPSAPTDAPATAPAPSDVPPRPTISVTPPPPPAPTGPATAPISQ